MCSIILVWASHFKLDYFRCMNNFKNRITDYWPLDVHFPVTDQHCEYIVLSNMLVSFLWHFLLSLTYVCCLFLFETFYVMVLTPSKIWFKISMGKSWKNNGWIKKKHNRCDNTNQINQLHNTKSTVWLSTQHQDVMTLPRACFWHKCWRKYLQ